MEFSNDNEFPQLDIFNAKFINFKHFVHKKKIYKKKTEKLS